MKRGFLLFIIGTKTSSSLVALSCFKKELIFICFFVGGDDCLLFKFDLRVGKVPVLKNRSHNAGVTSLHSNCNKEFVLASGRWGKSLELFC